MCRQLQGPCLLRRIQPENRAYILPGLRTAMHPSANSPFRLAFRIRGADRAEPSDWEIAGRYLSWTALPVLALALFIGGLR